jgi:hypothetical protein
MRDTIRRRRYGFMLLATALTVAGTASAADASAPATLTPAKLLPKSAQLNGVYCVTSTDCWAVGVKATASDGLVNQIVRWNGRKWIAVGAPSPGGTKMNDFSELSAVRCTSATNCWAVGEYASAHAALAEALHWNGKKWGQTSVPAPPGTGAGDFTSLIDVACTSATSCWAVGDDGNNALGSGVTRNFAIHWNGKKWFKITTPNPAGTKSNDLNILTSVRCTSAKDCWAGGTAGVDSSVTIQEDQMLHWNGTKWSESGVPSPAGFMVGAINEIEGLSCTSATDCWAVGDYGGGSVSDTTFSNLALHWNGHKWTQATTPNPDGTGSSDSNSLTSVTCSAANNCWAVGVLGGITVGGATTTEALHWKGTKWTLAKTPDPGGTASNDQNDLSDVRCVSAKDCWAVGFSKTDPNPDLNLTLRWNSVKWSA